MLTKVLLIGGGTMGEIILQGLLKLVPTESLVVAENNSRRADYIKKQYGVKTAPLSLDIVTNVETIILAVKPQDCINIAQELSAGLNNQFIISVMAGISTAALSKIFQSTHVIRVMPNLPAKIGMGMSAWTDTIGVLDEERTFTKKLLESFGKELYVINDDFIDKVTAVSGSGPAYVFLFAEHLMNAAQSLGLTADQVQTLVEQTILGSIELLIVSTEKPDELRKMVTSEKGTTAAALATLPQDVMRQAWEMALASAYQRAQELNLK